MVFSSMVFLWIFLPVVFLLSLLIRNIKAQNILLLIASLIFYAWGEPKYIFLMLSISLMSKKMPSKLFIATTLNNYEETSFRRNDP